MMRGNKLLGVLRSRKFWAALLSLLVATGLVSMEDGGAELAGGIAGGIGAIYILATAIEDGLSRREW